MSLLSGKVALVTGAASGIGRAVCKALSCEGAHIVAADMNLEGANRTVQDLARGVEHRACAVNVGERSSVTSLFTSFTSSLGPPTVVVNCAGIVRDAFLLDLTDEAFDAVINVNLKGTFLINQLAAKSMIEGKITEGSIVNISSIIGKTGNMGQCNYAASKAGVIGFTKSAAQELAKKGIRCNAVMPGFIETPMVAGVPEKVITMVLKNIPQGRKGTPEEIAEVVKFLATKQSSYITGAVLEVTGGLAM